MPALRVAVTMCVLACVANVATGATGFGSGILFHFMRACVALVDPSLSIPLVEVMWVLVVQNAASVPMLLWAVRGDVHKGLSCVMAVPVLIGLGIGTFLLVALASGTLKLVLGITVMFAAMWRWGIVVRSAAMAHATQERGVELSEPNADNDMSLEKTNGFNGRGMGLSTVVIAPNTDAGTPVDKPAPLACMPLNSAKFRAAASFAGAASGLLGGMFGIGGPPIMVFVTVMQIARGLARATQTVVAATAVVPQIIFLALASGVPDESTWLMLLGDAVGSVLGLLAGIRLYPYLSEMQNTVFILTMLSMSAATLVTDTFLQALFALLVIGAAVGLMYTMFRVLGRSRTAVFKR